MTRDDIVADATALVATDHLVEHPDDIANVQIDVELIVDFLIERGLVQVDPA